MTDGQRRTLLYIAAPYTDEDPDVRLQRFEATNRVAARFARLGIPVYSPISHWHPVAEQCGLQHDWGTWEHIDLAYLDVSWAVVVLCLTGWVHSRGVTAEIAAAKERGIPVLYMSPIDPQEEDQGVTHTSERRRYLRVRAALEEVARWTSAAWDHDDDMGHERRDRDEEMIDAIEDFARATLADEDGL